MIEGWDDRILSLYPDIGRVEATRTAEKLEAYLRLVLRIHERLSLEREGGVRVVHADGPLTNNSNLSSLPVEDTHESHKSQIGQS